MNPYPYESVKDYAARYRREWSKHRQCLYIGTTALHKVGDISRDEPDYFVLNKEDNETDEYYIGSWVTGFGFINVKFPKETSRPVTDEEFEWFLDNPTAMA